MTPLRRLILVLAATAPVAGILFLAAPAAAQEPVVDLDALLARTGAQLEQHFERRQSIIVTEIVSTRSFDRAMQLNGLPRRFEYERREEWGATGDDGSPTVTVIRDLLSVNGRAPDPNDDYPCTAPRTESEAPLAVLLPSRQAEFDIVLDEVDVIDGRAVARVELTPRETFDGEVEWDDECVSIELEGWYVHDAWIDVESGEVLRLDQRLMGRFEFREPAERPASRARWITLTRDDTSIRYERVTFANPVETLMLPQSVEQAWAIDGGGLVPRYFRTQRFENYRRFLTGGRLIAE